MQEVKFSCPKVFIDNLYPGYLNAQRLLELLLQRPVTVFFKYIDFLHCLFQKVTGLSVTLCFAHFLASTDVKFNFEHNFEKYILVLRNILT